MGIGVSDCLSDADTLLQVLGHRRSVTGSAPTDLDTLFIQTMIKW